MDDSEYRQMLRDNYGKSTSKELTPGQQIELVKFLQKQLRAKNGGRWDGFRRSSPWMATPRQMRAAEAMWASVSRAEPENRERALHSFCKRITGIDRLEWLGKSDIRKLMKAMAAMGAQTPEQYNRRIQPTTTGQKAQGGQNG
jgi:hypothetical protein